MRSHTFDTELPSLLPKAYPVVGANVLALAVNPTFVIAELVREVILGKI